MEIFNILNVIAKRKGKYAVAVCLVTLITACGSNGGGDGGSSSEDPATTSGSKTRAISLLDDFSQFGVTIETTDTSCEPENIGESAEYNMAINNELGNITVGTAAGSLPLEFTMDGVRFGSNTLVLSGQIDTYAHRVDFDEMEIFFQGADENGTFTHLSANFDWSFRKGEALCTGRSVIQGVKFDAFDHFESSPIVSSDGEAEWTLGTDSFDGEVFSFWGQVFNGRQLLQIGSALVDQAHNTSTTVTLAIAKYTGPGTYPINADEGNAVFVLQFDNGQFNNCRATPENNNTSGTITVQDQGDKVLVEYSAAMNCYSDPNFKIFTHMENSTGSFTVDENG